MENGRVLVHFAEVKTASGSNHTAAMAVDGIAEGVTMKSGATRSIMSCAVIPLTFRRALKQLDINTPRQERKNISAVDRDKWSGTARNFATHCASLLFEENARTALDYLHKRGLLDDTLLGWQIGYNPEDSNGDPLAWGLTENDLVFLPIGIVIPCFSEETLHYIKIRRGKGYEPKYLLLRGSQPFLYGAPTFQRSSMAFLFESELDVLLADQTGLEIGFGSIPAGQRLRYIYQRYFDGIEDLIIAFDNDEPGQKAADNLCLRSPHFHKAEPFPQGKDLTEYYQATGSLDSVLDWILTQLNKIGGTNGA